MENLNAEQIKKDLAMFIEDMPTELHFGFKRTIKFREFLKEALTLIKYHEQRIGELTEENKAISERYAIQVVTAIELDKQVQKLADENERLKENNVFLNNTIGKNSQQALEVTLEEIEKTKVNTVREMQERLQAFFGTYVLGYKIPLTDALKVVNKIAKEMLDGEK